MPPYEQLGLFYLGKRYDLSTRMRGADPVLYDSRHLLTHAVCVGMTGSGKTGLGIAMIEEAALDGIPVLAIDPKGDLANLLFTSPGVSPDDFSRWINPADAASAGIPPDAFAAREAERWTRGLREWDQDAARVARLRGAADVRIYTPGSRAATPLALLGALTPSGTDEEERVARAAAAARSILGLTGADGEAHSREQVLVTSLLLHAANLGQTVDLPWLVRHVQKPPFDRVGVLDLETFFPARERQALALDLNAVLAAPGSDVWLSGEPPDTGRLLYTPDGRPRIAIISIAHLDDVQRMLAVSLVLHDVLAWTRRQPGTNALRALVYMDEVAGYFPPVANPPSKPPLIALLKQARAFGVGVMLATQNPVDLDYKGLSNAGTWFLGKLQTERDKARVLDGLEGLAAGSLDRAELDRTLSALGARSFLLHDVHDAGPVVFETRWTLSYLRGPLTKEELRRVAGAGAAAAGTPTGETPAEGAREGRPVLPAGIREYFLPVAGARYEPRLYGSARVTYTDARRRIDAVRDVQVLVPFGRAAVDLDWQAADTSALAPESLSGAPVSPDARYDPLPAAAVDPRSYDRWEREFERWLIESRPLELFTAPRLKLSSQPDEAERDFRIRVQQRRHEERDAAVERLRARYAPRLDRLVNRLNTARQAAVREQQQAGHQQMQAAVSVGATVLGALLGRRAIGTSTLGRAATAARSASRAAKERQDVVRAEARVVQLEAELAALERELQREIDAIAAQSGQEPIERLAIRAGRGGVAIRLVALVWQPLAP